MKRALLVVAKEPVPGRVKTRLGGLFSPEATVRFYECLLLDTLHLMSQVSGVELRIVYTPLEARRYFEEIAPPAFGLHPQRGPDLGSRLLSAFQDHLARGYGQVVIMNSDSPTLPVAYVQHAFELLEGADAVFGPSEDGGYYLVGAKAAHPELFLNIQMSTSTVLEETLERARTAGLVVSSLPTWFDIDLPEDVAQLRAELARNGGAARHTSRFLRSMGAASSIRAIDREMPNG